MKKLIALGFGLLVLGTAQAQNVGINANGAAPNSSALLDLDVSAIAGTKLGLLVPRVTTAERTAIPTPATGLLVYDSSLNQFWYFNGTIWVPFVSGNPGWTILGNAGTSPTTNFIGTTDANDWVIKTGGSAATNERARVLAGGQTVVNITGLGLNTNDVFSVYASGTTNGITSNISPLGIKAISGYTSTGFGLYGNTTGTGAGTFGVYGLANAASGTPNAIRGEAASVNGLAIVGITNTSGGAIPTATNARAILGQVNGTLAGTAIGIGVQGLINPTMTTGDARGVQGNSPSDNGVGTLGFSTTVAATAFPIGVYGGAASVTGTGVFGNATSAGITSNPTGVLGQSVSSTGFGVDGFNANPSGTGILGEGNALAGTYLIGGSGGAFTGSSVAEFSLATTAANGTGVLAVGNGLGAFGTLAGGSGVAANGNSFGVYGVATSNALGGAGAPARAGGYFVSGTGGTQTYTYVACYEGGGVPRKVMGNGTVNTVVKNDNDDYVLLSAPEAPENLFQDYGTAQLVNGSVHVTLDPTLSRNILVNETHPLRVFIQLRGDCKGTYVTNETSEGFDVVELQGGTSSASFFWTVTGNRANQALPDGTSWNYAEERFARTAGPQTTVMQEARTLEHKHPDTRAADGTPLVSTP